MNLHLRGLGKKEAELMTQPQIVYDVFLIR